MVIMAPKDENELQHMLKTALHLDGPVAIRYPRGRGYGVPLDKDLKVLELGKAEVLHPGDQLVILALGVTVYPAIDAARKLKDEGIEAGVVNCRFVKPLDTELVCSLARRVGRVMTVEENVLSGGFGSAVLETLNDRDIRDVKVTCLGINDVFVEHGSQKVIRKKYGLDAEGIMRSAREMMDERCRKSSPQERSLG